jgi:hypothetical protein
MPGLPSVDRPRAGIDSTPGPISSSVGLPVRHTQKSAGSEDGLFMIVELAPAPTAFVQVWGYVDDAALAADQISLVAELQTESVADTVITGSYEPLRQ